MLPIDVVKNVGGITLSMAAAVGNMTTFTLRSLSNVFIVPFYFQMLWRSIADIGLRSVPVIAMSSFFMGSVFVMQTYIGLSRFHAETALADASVVAITRELGPLLVGLVLSGRVGASIAAEISAMKVTEQIEALLTLNTSPIRYLVVPRLLAAAITFPLLCLVADVIGVYGGYLVSTKKLASNPAFYITGTINALESYDVISGLIKTSFFGVTVAIVGSYYGLKASHGASGVGNTVTRAVVMSSALVLLLNYILTSFMFNDGIYA
jgi:phospholipid/cholesterol/gamma-HCH transport system permease protein